MKFRDPWIDPRVLQVRPAQAQAYLHEHGWKPVPSTNPAVVVFTGPGEGEEVPSVVMPVRMEEGAEYQRMIELVGDLALLEGRYVVEVLNDILSQAPAEASPPDGQDRALEREPAAR